MRALETLNKFLEYDFKTVLDIGSGTGEHAEYMRDLGRQVTTISLTPPADILRDYIHASFGEYGAIWCCHVLEHQSNVGLFLGKIYRDLVMGGPLAITVPPLKKKIKGGHLTLWTSGQLIYNLIVAGFDCSQARVKQYDSNISVLLTKKRADLPPLGCNKGDIARIAKFYPKTVKHNDDSDFTCRW